MLPSYLAKFLGVFINCATDLLLLEPGWVY